MSKNLIELVFGFGRGHVMKLGLIGALLGAMGVFITDFATADCKDLMCTILFLTKSSGAVALFGALRKWRDVADVKEKEAKVAIEAASK